MKPSILAPLLLALASAPALAQHAGHGPAPAATSATAPSTAAYQAANDKMHAAMAIPFSGNADRDFLAGMIGHHQGAIDMAEVELKYGKDAKVRKLAQAVIDAQKEEIRQMREWLREMDGKR